MNKIFKRFFVICLIFGLIFTACSCGKKNKKKDDDKKQQTDDNQHGNNPSGGGGNDPYFVDEYEEFLKTGKQIASSDIVKSVQALTNVSIPLPSGGSTQAVSFTLDEEELGNCDIILIKVTSSTQTASEYFNTLKVLLGSTWVDYGSTSSNVYGLVKYGDDSSDYWGFTITYGESSDTTFYITASYVEEEEGGLVTSIAAFANKLESLSGVKPTLPSTWLAVLDGEGDNYDGTKSWDALVSVNNVTVDDFNDWVDLITPSLTGFTKGNVDVTTSYGTFYSIKWTNSEGNYFYLDLDIYDTAQLVSFGYTYYDYSSSATWPTANVNASFNNKHNVPQFTGYIYELEDINFDEYYKINATGINDKDIQAYYDLLVKNDWKLYSSDDTSRKYVQQDDGSIFAVIDIKKYSSYDVSYEFKFSYETLADTSWPTNQVISSIGRTENSYLPTFNHVDGMYYKVTEQIENSITIDITGAVSEDLELAYEASLIDKGFSKESYYFILDLDNHDQIIVYPMYSPYYGGGYDEKIYITIEVKRYIGTGFNLPTNFYLYTESDLSGYIYGGIFAKVGNNYQLVTFIKDMYVTKNEIITYNSSSNTYEYKSGTGNYGGSMSWTTTTYSQAKVDEWIQKNLNYSTVKSSNLSTYTKEASPVTYCGVTCDKYTYVLEYGGTVYSKQEILVDRETNIPLYQASYNGEGVLSYASIEYSKFDKTITSFADAGISKCLEYNYNGTSDSDHVYGEEKVEEATCGTDGGIYASCIYCGHTKTIEFIPATGEHVVDDWMYDEDLHQHYQFCSECNQNVNYEDCTYTEWEIPLYPDCCNDGFKCHECTKCYHYEEEIIPADENLHVYFSWSIDYSECIVPTYDDEGLLIWHCQNDYDHDVLRMTLPALSNTEWYESIYLTVWDDEANDGEGGDVEKQFFALKNDKFDTEIKRLFIDNPDDDPSYDIIWGLADNTENDTINFEKYRP